MIFLLHNHFARFHLLFETFWMLCVLSSFYSHVYGINECTTTKFMWALLFTANTVNTSLKVAGVKFTFFSAINVDIMSICLLLYISHNIDCYLSDIYTWFWHYIYPGSKMEVPCTKTLYLPLKLQTTYLSLALSSSILKILRI